MKRPGKKKPGAGAGLLKSVMERLRKDRRTLRPRG
jgi:hypothetical protein